MVVCYSFWFFQSLFVRSRLRRLQGTSTVAPVVRRA
jgi:hypothetical protein